MQTDDFVVIVYWLYYYIPIFRWVCCKKYIVTRLVGISQKHSEEVDTLKVQQQEAAKEGQETVEATRAEAAQKGKSRETARAHV